ncbi:Cas1p-domain-containing protein [Xylariomycetidae sp. FL0641]|nr:Cas1p-domain-containing protein [Xylariomycetidae sp. FL0641]
MQACKHVNEGHHPSATRLDLAIHCQPKPRNLHKKTLSGLVFLSFPTTPLLPLLSRLDAPRYSSDEVRLCLMTQLRRFAASWHPLAGVTYSTLILVLLWLSYQSFTAGQHDPSGCQALLTDGAWSPPSSSRAQEWEPSGCRMVEYSSDDVHDCLTGQKVVLAGDSTIRQLYWAAARKLDPVRAEAAATDAVATAEKHESLSFEAVGVRLEFLWDPWLNSTTLHNVLKSFRVSPTTNEQKVLKEKDEASPALIVLGTPGLWAARYGGDDYMALFKGGLDRISSQLAAIREKTTSPTPDAAKSNKAAENQILLSPVQVPAYGSLSQKRAESITPARVDEMNQYLSHSPLAPSSQVVWAFNRMTDEASNAFTEDGLHVGDAVAERKLDIVLNSRCNNPGTRHGRSFKGACCVAEPRNEIYNVVLISLCAVALYLSRSQSASKSRRRCSLPNEFFSASRDILIALLWCWICDGTLQLGKAERHYQQGPFIALSLFWLIGSFAVLSQIVRPLPEMPWSTSKKHKPDPLSDNDQEFLSRNQTDEIKGLMQGLILLYHYNHASQTLWVYKIVRVLISAYFFLSAYGHTLYTLRTEDYSFRRMATVLFRINALSALLPYVMGTTYSSYYFAPVITFWYLVVFAMLRIFKRSNADPWPLAMKVLATASLTSRLITEPGVLESVARALHMVFGMSWDVQEMRFRLGLERYIVFAGVMVASLINCAAVNDAHEIFQAKGTPSARDNVRFLVVCGMMISLFFYFTETTLPTKEDYNASHPYITWIPILAGVVIRNLHAPARKAYLAIPAALGKISLETYVLQYHIWLGADATAKLTLGFDNVWGSLLEKLVITLIFIGVAALTHRATRALTSWLSLPGFLAFLAILWIGNLVHG